MGDCRSERTRRAEAGQSAEGSGGGVADGAAASGARDRSGPERGAGGRGAAQVAAVRAERGIGPTLGGGAGRYLQPVGGHPPTGAAKNQRTSHRTLGQVSPEMEPPTVHCSDSRADCWSSVPATCTALK